MVGNKHCSYGLCNSDARYSHRDHMKDVFFVPFPKPHRNLVRCQLWVRACGRAEFTIANIKRNSYICSKHFIGGRGPTDDQPDPMPFVATDAEIRESETRGRVGRGHRKRINLAVSSSESDNSQQSRTVDNQACSSGPSQYYTLVTLPENAVSGSHMASTTSSTTTTTSSIVSPKLLLISQPQATKGQNKQSNLQTSHVLPVSVNNKTILEQDTRDNLHEQFASQALPSTGQIVAVKKFVIHGQKYTAVHINPEGQEVSQAGTNNRSRRKQQKDSGNGIFISRNGATIAVPELWCAQQDSNSVTFRRISSSDSVLLSVTYIEDSAELIIKVLGMQITSHPILESLPNPVKLNNMTFVLKQFDRWKVCIGNPDEKFQAIFHQRPKTSAFYSWIDDSVHSKSCELLCLKDRCMPCKNYRGYLRCLLNREQKKLGKTSLESFQENAAEPEDSGQEEMLE